MAPTARAALIRPERQRAPVPGIGSQVASMRARTAALEVPNGVLQTRPARPATNAVAWEVPLTDPYPWPQPVGTFGSVERILAPGAATSTQFPDPEVERRWSF